MYNALEILNALGGKSNIVEFEPCVTRLRIVVCDAEQVDLEALKPPVCHGTSVDGSAIQVIVGPEAEEAACELNGLLQ